MNDILGGGGFTSRITQRVRSDEGLAYSAGSQFAAEVFWPGQWRASFESKNATCALAAKLVLEEMARIRSSPVTAQELDTAKKSFIETFPETFSSRDATLGVFMTDEWTKRPGDYWTTFRDKVAKVTPADIQRVAQKYLDPSKVTILVVGKWDEIAKGDQGGRATMAMLEKDLGPTKHLPLRDPMTLAPLPMK
jgi:predicted Zn-dependent peptidase